MSRTALALLLIVLVAAVVFWPEAGAVPGAEPDSSDPDSLTAGSEARGAETPGAAMESVASGPILVELFTSQGCSSCPAADRLLSRLTSLEAGVEVIPLAYHVDYWNYIGWTDPFSSRAWSERQRRYAQALGHGRVYTPQLVIQGASDCVGSNADKVLDQIGRATRRASLGQVTLEVARASNPRSMSVEVAARVNGSERLNLMLAVFESGLVTGVDRGENASRTLHNDFVVRSLKSVIEIEGGAADWQSRRVVVELDPTWKSERLGVAAFLQDPERLSIHGSAVQQPPLGG